MHQIVTIPYLTIKVGKIYIKKYKFKKIGKLLEKKVEKKIYSL